MRTILPAYDLSKAQQKKFEKLQALAAAEEPSQEDLGGGNVLKRDLLKLRGITLLQALHKAGTRVASLDDGSWTPWITAGPVYLRGREQGFKSFYDQVKATCQGNSAKNTVAALAGAGDLVGTLATPMIGAIVTIAYINDAAIPRCMIPLALAWTINGAPVNNTVQVVPAAHEGSNHKVAQFVVLAAADNAGESSVALATQLVCTLAAGVAAHVANGTTISVESLNLRDIDA